MANQPVPRTIQAMNEERGMPRVGDLPSGGRRKKMGVIFLGALLLLTLICVYHRYTHASHKEVKESQKDIQLTSVVPKRDFEEEKAPEPLALNTIATSSLQDSLEIKPPMVSGVDKSSSTLMIPESKDTQTSIQTALTQANTNIQSNSELATLLNAMHTPAQSASLLENRHYLLAKGSFIDCVLQTKLDSTVPGMTSCVVTRNIYSDNGKVLLIERGSTVSGEYQSNLHQGQNRIFVLWTRVKTPSGVVIDLDSPGADSLGGSGLPGYIDHHFWQRFGGALMLSLVQDASSAGANAWSEHNGQNTINVSNTAGATQYMATEALKNTINIPPTLYKNQGERIGIYVARDLNFADVYDLKLK